MILLEEEQARRALEEERMRMEEHARQREQMIGGPPRGRWEPVSHTPKDRGTHTAAIKTTPGKRLSFWTIIPAVFFVSLVASPAKAVFHVTPKDN